MEPKNSRVRLIATAVGLVVLIAAWLQLAPSAMGGGITYLVTTGNSMNPSYHEGDLVLIRAKDTYDVGDVIAYHSDLIGVKVMHRIVDDAGETFRTQGDNNTWLDEDRPLESQIIGSPWAHIPGGGKYVRWFTKPLHAAVLLSVAGVISFGGIFGVPKRRRQPGAPLQHAKPKRSSPPKPPSSAAELVVVLCLAVAIPFAVLSVIAFTKPPDKVVVTTAAYSQSGEFNYFANVKPGPVYDQAFVVTGEPIFRRLVGSFDVEFKYRFSALAPHAVSGSASLIMELSEKNGWKRTFELQPMTPFAGDEFRLNATVDLAAIDQVLEEVIALTGVKNDHTLISFIAEIDAGGTVAAQPCCNAFAKPPELSFLRNLLQLTPTTDGYKPIESLEPLRSTATGEVRNSRIEPRELSFLGIDFKVREARTVGLVGMAMQVAYAVAFGYLLGRGGAAAEPDRIERTYGHLLVAAEAAPRVLDGNSFRLPNMKSLARMAERLDTVILHIRAGASHSYLVYDGSAAYTYTAQDATRTDTPEQDDAPDLAA